MKLLGFLCYLFLALAVTFFIGGVNTGEMLTDCRAKLAKEGKE